MKKVHLHGQLGKKFGETWDLHVDSPMEAISAICANNPEIKKYLKDSENKGITYGIRKASGEVLENKDELALKTEQDLHIFPVPEGSGGGFLVSLLVTAATTAASMYISKKISEAMERDDTVLQAQTQSFLYNGKQNRFQQGSTVPLGYGKMIVGSNVISSCISNYDYSAEKVKILNFSSGLYSLVPAYIDQEAYDALGPLIASFGRNAFDGSSEYRIVDPAYQYIKNQEILNAFGTVDGLYGGYTDAEVQRKQIVQKEGDSLAGWMIYKWNYAKGVNKELLANFDPNSGNWAPGKGNTDSKYAIPAEEVVFNSYVCVQSDPVLETEKAEFFYPITFSEESLPELKGNQEDISKQINAWPIQVGERWIGGSKNNGLGWYKLESAAVYKAIDLICEGSIDGFASKNGELLEIDKEHKTNSANENKLRNSQDDYLQAIFLDESPVKEVDYINQLDTYNINEFDIDIGTSSNGIIGADDQLPMKPQYLFSADTKDINAPLFGPRSISLEDQETSGSVSGFKKNKTFDLGVYVFLSSGGSQAKYRVNKSLSNPFSSIGLYGYQSDLEKATVVYTGSEYNAKFYYPDEGFDEIIGFSGYTESLDPGTVIVTPNTSGGHSYYVLGSRANLYLGTYNVETDYSNQVGKIIGYKGLLLKIQPGIDNSGQPTPAVNSDAKPGASPTAFASIMSLVTDGDEDFPTNATTAFGEILLQENNNIIQKRLDIKPGGSDDTTYNLWNKLEINSPTEILNESGTNIASDIKIFNEGSESSASSKYLEEENYVSHTIINPLVDQAYVALQVDELSYIYQGDEVEVTYKIGTAWAWITGGLAIYHGVKAGFAYAKAASAASLIPAGPALAATHTADAKKELLTAVGWGLVSLFIATSDGFSMGTKIENSGETWPNRAKFRIKYGNEGETLYSTDVHMYGVSTSPFRKDIKLYLPPNPEKRDRIIKVYKLNRERNLVKEGEQAARYKERMSLASVTEITPVKLSYPNSVVIGTRVNAKDYPSLPNRTYNLRLKRIPVPNSDTYDPETRRYLQNWNGLFAGQQEKNDSIPEDAKVWTDNPAWCMYDLISNKNYGVGRFGIKKENIDKWTIYKIAKYCDEFIPTGYSPKYKKRTFLYGAQEQGGFSIEILGNVDQFASEFNHPNKKLALFYSDGTYDALTILKIIRSENKIILKHKPLRDSGFCATEIDYPLVEPRYTLNTFILNQENAFKLINEFATIFRAFAYWHGGSINFFQDEKKDSVMLFSNNNIEKGGFSYSNTPKTSRTNVCKVKYLDKFNKYRPKLEYAEDRESVKNNNIIEQSIDGFGITSQGQAKRAAEFMIKSANMETEMIAFKTGMVGAYLRPGDVIDVLDNKRTIGKFSGKVLDIEVSADGRTASIYIDYPIPSIIDRSIRSTWKDITFYFPVQNETIESLDEAGSPTDEQIDNLRSVQIRDYEVTNISEDGKILYLSNTPYTYIEGNFTWIEALEDAESRGGVLARVYSEEEQQLIEEALPYNESAWLGGYYREKPEPARWVWQKSKKCTINGDGITYFKWRDEYPNPDVSEASEGNYIYVQGEDNPEVNDLHGDWIHSSPGVTRGYILETPSDDTLRELNDVSGTICVIEDDVNFANKKQYKVLNLKEESNGIFSVQGLQYSREKFDNIEKDMSISEPSSPVIFTEKALAPPSGISIEFLDEDIPNNIPYGLKATWETDSAAAYYRVQFFDQNDLLSTFEVINDKDSSESSFSYRDKKISEEGNYYARIYSVPN